jgi:hypothetical protein
LCRRGFHLASRGVLSEARNILEKCLLFSSFKSCLNEKTNLEPEGNSAGFSVKGFISIISSCSFSLKARNVSLVFSGEGVIKHSIRLTRRVCSRERLTKKGLPPSTQSKSISR